jgi:hypothetical protein
MKCVYATSGFDLPNGTGCRPCGTTYHPLCISAGHPFTSRRTGRLGLVFPNVRHWANFVCECCTVRAVLGRELGLLGDSELLLLERMRIIDIAHSWSPGTHTQYQSKLTYVQGFEARHPGLNILSLFHPPTPPTGPTIPLMWAEEAYSLRLSNRRDNLPVTYGTVRQLRAAVSQYHRTGLINGHTGSLHRDQQGRVSITPGRATDDASLKHFSDGLSARIGNEAKPSVSLLDRHVRAVDDDCTRRYNGATTARARLLWARAGLVNQFLWLGWLRSSEVFGLHLQDLEIIEPHQAASRDLPAGCGAIVMWLNPETKTSRQSRADVVLAYRTISGHRPGLWVKRLLDLLHTKDPMSHLFAHAGGSSWDSLYFRRTFLYPVLTKLRDTGDPYLRPYANIPAALYSLHSYRRGARTQASKLRGSLTRRATPDEIYEHARWRKSRSSERIDVIYREWPIADRVQLTLHCM